MTTNATWKIFANILAHGPMTTKEVSEVIHSSEHHAENLVRPSRSIFSKNANSLWDVVAGGSTARAWAAKFAGGKLIMPKGCEGALPKIMALAV